MTPSPLVTTVVPILKFKTSTSTFFAAKLLFVPVTHGSSIVCVYQEISGQ